MKRFISTVEALLVIVLFITMRAWIGYNAVRSIKGRQRRVA